MGFLDSFNKTYNEKYAAQCERMEPLRRKHDDEERSFARYSRMSDSALSEQLKNIFLPSEDRAIIQKILDSRKKGR